MTFRGKNWKKMGTHYALINDAGEDAQINVHQFNSGVKACFVVEVIGLDPRVQSVFIVKSIGQKARDTAIAMAVYKAKELGRF